MKSFIAALLLCLPFLLQGAQTNNVSELVSIPVDQDILSNRDMRIFFEGVEMGAAVSLQITENHGGWCKGKTTTDVERAAVFVADEVLNQHYSIEAALGSECPAPTRTIFDTNVVVPEVLIIRPDFTGIVQVGTNHYSVNQLQDLARTNIVIARKYYDLGVNSALQQVRKAVKTGKSENDIILKNKP